FTGDRGPPGFSLRWCFRHQLRFRQRTCSGRRARARRPERLAEHARLAAHAVWPVIAVAVRVLRQVLLVLILREVELAGRGIRQQRDLRGDGAKTALGEGRLPRLDGLLRLGELLSVQGIDCTAVLRADVIALPVALG